MTQRPEPRTVDPYLRRHGTTVYEAEAPPLVPRQRTGSLADIPFTNATEAPQDVVLGRKGPGGRWTDVTAATFADEVLALAKGLMAAGLQPGDRLAIMSRTTYEWTLLDFAAWAAGLITVPVYPTSSSFQAEWILADSGSVACAVENVDQARMVSAARAELPWLTQLWQLDTGVLGQLAAAGRHIPDAEVHARRTALTPDSVATVMYTSGTTGTPKGCVATHANFLAEVDNAIELLHPVFRAPSREPAATLLFLPLSHVLGRMTAVGALRARVRLGHAPSMTTEDLIADLRGFRPTFLVAIPYVLEKVFNSARATAERMGRAASFDRASRVAERYGEALEQREHGGTGPGSGQRTLHRVYDTLVYRRIRAALGGRVRHIISGGSPLGRRLGLFYAGAGVEVYEGYGLTETTGAATVTPPLRLRFGRVGRPLPGTSVRIAPDGEVLLRGGQVFAGYWDSEAGAVRPAIREDGYLPTGDIGALDEDGYLTITGRKKDLIVTSSGKNLAPGPLEDRLRAHPLISQCLVVGDNRPYVAALLTLDMDGLYHWCHMHKLTRMSARQLLADARLHQDIQHAVDGANLLVSRAESIRRYRVLPLDFKEDAGYLTPSLKLRRGAILRDFAADVDALYE
ncbi:Long-chain-fatty-acid--CoA ligase FadD15 [Streptomyces sp. RB5]|uniref:Acyl-CoA synthetase n=1 Tax=Streptomyces smaragdinus TaxID=2585196 RepID=A0A7K0CIW5_9ACTN|nr:AMP-dependent synthetase/ligase [Streptomyces smaragdinus]MQY13425.1 Long-chain-fatty-acid--CoA ligase FadD15 [Streptomyces smaragdinus]